LNKLCQANKRYKNSNLKIQRAFIPTMNQNQRMILCHVKIILLIKITLNQEFKNCRVLIIKIANEVLDQNIKMYLIKKDLKNKI
jgi:hypothetical protein